MADATSLRLDYRDIAIVGGGCYGTFYAGQLLRARERGAVSYRRILIVDRDPACQYVRDRGDGPDRELVVAEWDDFFDRWLGDDAEADAIVPSPLMPHLMFDWVLRRARVRWPGRTVEQRPLPRGPGTPYDTAAPDGTRYVSFADWLCPVHCIEPAVCPVIRGPRTWEIAEAAERLAQGEGLAGPILFQCRHRTYGVGMFDVAEVLAGDARVAAAGERPVDFLVGTVSSCHGALGLLHLGGPPV